MSMMGSESLSLGCQGPSVCSPQGVYYSTHVCSFHWQMLHGPAQKSTGPHRGHPHMHRNHYTCQDPLGQEL